MYGYYENIVNMINNDMLLNIVFTEKAKDSKGNERDVYFTLEFLNKKKCNVYKGTAKPKRLDAVFNALKNKGYKLGGNYE